MKKLIIAVLCLGCIQFISAQSKTIKGKVLDQTTKEGLPFASIHVPNTLVGTMTNEVGAFELKVKESIDTIQISYLGYLDEVVILDGDIMDLTVALKQWGIDLEEVIVNPQTPLYYIKKAIVNYPNSISNQPFETTAFFAEKSSILNDQSDAYEMDEAVFKTYYEDFSDTLDTDSQLILHRAYEQGEMQTMLERNKRIKKTLDKDNKRKAEKLANDPDADIDADTVVANKNEISIDGFTGAGPSDLLKGAQDLIDAAFFDKEYFKKFKYTFGEPTFYKNRKLMVIHFKNKRKVDHTYYDGTVYLDYEDYSIVVLKYNAKAKIPWWANALIKGIAGFKISGVEFNLSVNNQFLNNYWYPKELRKEVVIEMKQKGETEKIGAKQILNIYNIDITNPNKISEAKAFDAEIPYEDQIFNERVVKWSDVNVVKL